MGEKEWSCHFIEQCGNGLLPNRTLGYFGTLGYQGDVKLKNNFFSRDHKNQKKMMKLKEELYTSCREGAAGRVKAILLKNPELINQVRPSVLEIHLKSLHYACLRDWTSIIGPFFMQQLFTTN
jgi:hypothetical protein